MSGLKKTTLSQLRIAVSEFKKTAMSELNTAVLYRQDRP